MTTKTVTVRLHAATSAYQAAMAKASASTKQLSRDITGVGNVADKDLKRISRGALLAAGGLAVGLGLSAKAAIDWESAWAGVTKTVDGSVAQLADLQSGLRGLAGELPATHAEIAGVAEVAGQLGVSVGGIEKFTDTMIDLGETTDLSAEQAATALAQMANIMGTSERDVERMGSTIVELGNNSATTESDIVDMAQRLATAGKAAGLSEADVFAFSSTLSSMGIEAEAGGTALSQAFIKIRDATIDGGEDLETFAQIAGVSATHLKQAFQDDAAGAIEMVISGLGRMVRNGESTTGVLKDVGLTGIRVRQALEGTAAAGDLLSESLGMANNAWEDNTALQTEAEQRYKTTAAQMEIARNKVVDLGIDLGTTLLPVINKGIDLVGGFADGLALLPGPAQTGIVAFAGLSATLAGTIGIVGTLAPKFNAAKTALNKFGGANLNLGNSLGKVAGWGAAAGAAIAAGVYIYGEATRASREYEANVRELVQTFDQVTKGQLAFNDAISELQTERYDELSDKAKTALSILDLGMGDFQRAVEAGGDALDPLRDKFADAASKVEYLGGTLADIDLGKFDDTKGSTEFNAALDQLAETAGLTRKELQSLIEEMEDYDNEQQESARRMVMSRLRTDDLSDAQAKLVLSHIALNGEGGNWLGLLKEISPATSKASSEARTFTSAADAEADALSNVAQAIDDVADALAAQFDPLFAATDAVNDLAEAQLAAAEATTEFGAGSVEAAAANDEMVRAALANDEAMIRLRGSIERGEVSLDDTISTLYQWAAQGKITKEAADEMAGKFRDVGGEADRLDGYNINMALHLEGYDRAMAQLYELSRNRTVTVSVLAQAGPRYQSIVRGNDSGNNRWGGISKFAYGGVTSYAGGGIHAHVARGDLIRYAEPETGGEAFIPRFGDRGRSMSILGEAAGWYGASVIDRNDWAAWNRTHLANQPAGGSGAGGSIDYDRLASAVAGQGLVIENATFGETGVVRDLDFFARSKMSGL